MLLLMGGMVVIVLFSVYFYKDYLLEIGNEISSNEIAELNQAIENISSNFS
ncbi:MAG: hypothetical protein LBM26_02145 [Methanobrevibacter sp.]|nr:hypothetical protein [Methanobrevibacter sp.]